MPVEFHAIELTSDKEYAVANERVSSQATKINAPSFPCVGTESPRLMRKRVVAADFAPIYDTLDGATRRWRSHSGLRQSVTIPAIHEEAFSCPVPRVAFIPSAVRSPRGVGDLAWILLLRRQGFALQSGPTQSTDPSARRYRRVGRSCRSGARPMRGKW